MSNIVTIGFSTEGTTDKRFLGSIIKNTFEEVAMNCEGLIEIFEPEHIDFPKGDGFVEGVKKLSKIAFDKGIYILCIHTDADNRSDIDAFTNKINPAVEAVNLIENENICKNIVAIVPIQMTEAWMLADKLLFKEEINTDFSDNDLGINKEAETIFNPKSVIENAIRISQEHLPQRRQKLTIADIYQPIGQKISIATLDNLSSFQKFKFSVVDAFRKLNYLHD